MQAGAVHPGELHKGWAWGCSDLGLPHSTWGARGQGEWQRSPCGDTKQGAEVTPVGATAPCPPGAALSRIIPLRGLLAPRERGLCWGGVHGVAVPG